jgi:hypothetical protein
VGSSDGAIVHLAAAMDVPWLPQTFLVPVARRADPDDVRCDEELGRRIAAPPLTADPALQLHQMHDPNQDRLMVAYLAYFRFKLRQLPPSYRSFISAVLEPGGTVVIVDDQLRWPVSRLGERHVLQAGAYGGLAPADYLRRWPYSPPDELAPEAEWGYVDDLTAQVCELGYPVRRLRIPEPGAVSEYVADVYREWYERQRAPVRQLVAETFICIEPEWMLRSRSVPFWLPFPVQSSADRLAAYLSAQPNRVGVTLFAHGTRSDGLAPVQRWRQFGELIGVDARRWPADFAALARYSPALDRFAPADGRPAEPLRFADVLAGSAGASFEPVP